MMLTANEAYKLLFCEYPDVVNVKQMCEMLGGISEKTGYRLLHNGDIGYFTIGRSYRIPKIHVLAFLLDSEEMGAKN